MLPGAIGLRYKCPSSGLFRQLLMDSNKTCFYEPVDGWEDQIFYVIYYSGVPITDTEIIKEIYDLKKKNAEIEKKNAEMEKKLDLALNFNLQVLWNKFVTHSKEFVEKIFTFLQNMWRVFT
uniref:TAR DNA-binding protein 43 N-terminal domain-containing protein n=1 Tax=Meloidogyne enterolobii TaxID=390850 RepID=A0A6V7X1A5_MELEN|nr:unnamed protein product [Meloidogyne enterolobii]